MSDYHEDRMRQEDQEWYVKLLKENLKNDCKRFVAWDQEVRELQYKLRIAMDRRHSNEEEARLNAKKLLDAGIIKDESTVKVGDCAINITSGIITLLPIMETNDV